MPYHLVALVGQPEAFAGSVCRWQFFFKRNSKRNAMKSRFKDGDNVGIFNVLKYLGDE